MALRNQVQLIAYPNRLGSNLSDLADFLEKYCVGKIGGVHLLPPYPSNADGGFSPLTHKEIDPVYGDWSDFDRLSKQFDVCLDLMINHISDESKEFKDFIKHGKKSDYADLFVLVDDMGEITEEDLAKIHIRKEKEPFREVTFADGSKGRVWCTFTEQQIDLNYSSPQTHALIEDYIQFLTGHGVKLFRLDAFGYTTKQIGTSCFLVEPDVYDLLKWVDDTAKEYGAETLPEVHDHVSYQYAIALHGLRPYGFAMAPLVLYTLLEGNSSCLKEWLRMCPRNQITVLDTHDGICIPDVEGVLTDEAIKTLIKRVSERSGDPIMRGSAANVHSVGAIYQLTCTYYDALERDDDAYLAARAIQLFAPGIPQVYYVGLLAGENDHDLLEETGEPRDINRQFFSKKDIDQAMQKSVVKRLLRLMQFRSSYPAFDGVFHLQYSDSDSVAMCWRTNEHTCELYVDLTSKQSTIRYIDVKSRRWLTQVV